MVVNLIVGVTLVLLAWARGARPGVGTVAQPLVVGLTVSAGLQVLDEPASTGPARCCSSSRYRC